MPKADFLPSSDPEFVAWHDNFKSAADANLAAGIVSEEDHALVTADNIKVHTTLDHLNLIAATHRQATADKNDTFATVGANTRAIARRIKARADYKPAIGSRFGIEGTAISTNLSNAKPTLTGIDHTGGSVELRFNKLKSDGVNIYCQREGDTDWVLLAHVSSSPYFDNRPLLQTGKPELRRYTIVYLQNDQEVGQYSDEVVISCAP